MHGSDARAIRSPAKLPDEAARASQPRRRRILIIKPSAIGDIVHALPVLNLLRRKWPAAHISWLVSSACAGLLDGHPQIDEADSLRSPAISERAGETRRRCVGLFRFTRALRDREVRSGHRSSGPVSQRLAGRQDAVRRSASAPPRRGSLAGFSTRTALRPASRTGHAVDRYLDIAEALGLGREPVEFVFATDDADRAGRCAA